MIKVIKNIFSVSNGAGDNKNRVEMLDFLRGGAMILVLLHHSGFPYGRWILAFHMPLFFMLSGYTESIINNYSKHTFGSFVLNRFKRLMMPYFIFETINLLIWYIRCFVLHKSIHFISPLISIIICVNTDSYTGLCGRLWFLPCMFVSSIALYVILRFVKNKYGLCCVVGMLLFLSWLSTHIISFRLPFTLDTSLMATAFMLIGYLLTNSIKFYMEKGHLLIDIASAIILLGILYYTNRSNKAGMLMFINRYGEYIFSIVGAFAGSIAYVILAKYVYYLFRRIKLLKNFVLWYSYNSLATFPVHLEIKCVLLLFGIPFIDMWWVLFLVMLLGNIIIVNVITNYLPFLLFQKYKSKKRI